jgi:hypothetical protein
MVYMTTEADTPTQLDVARERLARSRVQFQQHFLPGGEGPAGAFPLVRGLAVKGVRALISGSGNSGSGLQVGLAVAGLLMMLLTRRSSRGRGLGLMISLAIALMRFSRRR